MAKTCQNTKLGLTMLLNVFLKCFIPHPSAGEILEKERLRRSEFDDFSCQALAEGLKENSTLMNLTLEDINIGPEGAKAWCLVRMVWSGKGPQDFIGKIKIQPLESEVNEMLKGSERNAVDLCWYSKLQVYLSDRNDFEDLRYALSIPTSSIGRAHSRNKCTMILRWLFCVGQIGWGLD